MAEKRSTNSNSGTTTANNGTATTTTLIGFDGFERIVRTRVKVATATKQVSFLFLKKSKNRS
jgi:hypothetical protein